DGARQAAAEVLQASLARLNPKFRVRIDAIPGDEFYPELEGRRLALFASGHYSDYPDPQDYAFGLLHSRGYYPTYQSFADPRLDDLVEKASAQMDAAKRQRLYVEAARIAREDAPAIYLY